MSRYFRLLLLPFLLLGQSEGRQLPGICGTSRERVKEELHLHRQALKLRRGGRLGLQSLGSRSQVAAQPRTAARDIGDVAVLEDTDGIVGRRNDFDLDNRTVTFSPASASAGAYRFAVAGQSYDIAAADAGARVQLGDDDAQAIDLPFSFPFFGKAYRQVYINSDGNLTFGASDTASSERSLGRIAAGPPRIAPLFTDLNPAASQRGVRVLSEPSRLVITWPQVPEYVDAGAGAPQTFQVRLYPDGRIEFAYYGISSDMNAVVGIGPGGLQGSSSVVSFLDGSAQTFTSTVAERFSGTMDLDLVTAAQKFYETHDDSYEYLVIFNNMGIPDGPTSLASERTVRQLRSGIGDTPIDVGQYFGSAKRLLAVVNMGYLAQYADFGSYVPGREASHDTPLSILAHEAGHLFLAYASVRDSSDPAARPMLGFQNGHWSFDFNSDASFLEGNRIQDNCPGATAGCSDGQRRFKTIGVTEHFAPLDQYLMGLRAPEEVSPTFVVTNSTRSPLGHPRLGVEFDGSRRDIRVDEVIQAEGRRTPDHTVEQHRYRFAFILITQQGTDTASAAFQADLQKVNEFRERFAQFFAQATDNRAAVETSLRRTLRFSTYPAAGILAGAPVTAYLNLDKPADSAFSVTLSAANGFAAVPQSINVPAGATSVAFQITGKAAGVEELTATPGDARYESSFSRIQVASSAAGLQISAVSGQKQSGTAGVPLPAPVVFRVTDANNLPYPGVRVQIDATAGGSADPASVVTNQDGIVSVKWTPANGAANILTASIQNGPSATVTTIGPPVFAASDVVNSATLEPGLSPGALGTLRGLNFASSATAANAPWPTTLGGVQVLLNGKPAPLLYASESQVNFQVPLDMQPGQAEIRVVSGLGSSGPAPLTLSAVSPGIFVIDAANKLAAVQIATTYKLTTETPARPGVDYISVYCTGLGPIARSSRGFDETTGTPDVYIAGIKAAEIQFSGMVPGLPGLYVVNARVPQNAPSGMQEIWLSVGGQTSNRANLKIQ